MNLLSISELDAGYADLEILKNIVLTVKSGEYVSIVGPNGAGKSTIMKSIFGLTQVYDGKITFKKSRIDGMQTKEIIKEGISYVPQVDNVFPPLTVIENLQMGAYILEEIPQDRLDMIFKHFPDLKERKDQKVGSMSGGQQKMVAIGRALMLNPDLLMLDEPSAGLAPNLVNDMFDKVDKINDAGTSILMVEQNAKEALKRCDRGYVIAQGQNRFVDEGEVLLSDETVRREFLGG
jgi:branched-chain amino acid transport system ATP-binding protein